MIKYLKKGKSDTLKIQEEIEIRNKVEDILKELKKGGDKAVLKLSEKFDNYSPKSFRLSQEEIENAIKEVSKQDLDDIKFAQKQIQNFAEKQNASLKDIKVGQEVTANYNLYTYPKTGVGLQMI